MHHHDDEALQRVEDSKEDLEEGGPAVGDGEHSGHPGQRQQRQHHAGAPQRGPADAVGVRAALEPDARRACPGDRPGHLPSWAQAYLPSRASPRRALSPHRRNPPPPSPAASSPGEPTLPATPSAGGSRGSWGHGTGVPSGWVAVRAGGTGLWKMQVLDHPGGPRRETRTLQGGVSWGRRGLLPGPPAPARGPGPGLQEGRRGGRLARPLSTEQRDRVGVSGVRGGGTRGPLREKEGADLQGKKTDDRQTGPYGEGTEQTDRNRNDRRVPLLAGPALPSPGEQLPYSEAFAPSSRKSSRSTSEAGITLCTPIPSAPPWATREATLDCLLVPTVGTL